MDGPHPGNLFVEISFNYYNMTKFMVQLHGWIFAKLVRAEFGDKDERPHRIHKTNVCVQGGALNTFNLYTHVYNQSLHSICVCLNT